MEQKKHLSQFGNGTYRFHYRGSIVSFCNNVNMIIFCSAHFSKYSLKHVLLMFRSQLCSFVPNFECLFPIFKVFCHDFEAMFPLLKICSKGWSFFPYIKSSNFNSFSSHFINSFAPDNEIFSKSENIYSITEVPFVPNLKVLFPILKVLFPILKVLFPILKICFFINVTFAKKH